MPTADERWSDDTLAALARDEPFLRQLALRLVRDPGTADDLVQETWLRAFSLRPAIGEGLYGWSSTVLRRLAARQRRGEARRAAREAAAARPERQDDPLDAVQRRVDAQAALVVALRRLSPEQREALVLRHAEERSLADIAARQGTSVATVKSRLAHGLAALRADLDRRAGGERGAHGLVLAPLLAPTLRRGRWLTTGAPTLTLAGGALLMGNTMKISFVAVALVAIAFVMHQVGSGPPRPTDATSPIVASTDAELTPGDAPVALEGPTEDDGRVASVPTASDAATAPEVGVERELVVRVAGPSGRTARIVVSGIQHVGSVVGTGRADFEVEVPGEVRCPLAPLVTPLPDGTLIGALRVRAEASGCPIAVLEVPLDTSGDAPTFEVELTLRTTAIVTGSVVTQAGSMWISAFALESGDRLGRYVGGTQVGGHGAFSVPVDHAGEVALVVTSTDHQPATVRCWVTRGSETRVGPLELVPAVAIQGLVVAHGTPKAGAHVVAVRVDVAGSVPVMNPERYRLSDHGGPTQLAWSGGTFLVTRSEATSGDGGSFHLGGLAPGAHAVSVREPTAARASWGGAPEPVTISAPAEGVRLESGWAELRLECEVPYLFEGQGTLLVGEPGWTPQGTGLSGSDLLTDPVLVVGLRPGVTTEVRVEFAGFEPVVHEVRAERAGEVLRRAVQLRRPPGSVRLTLALSGAPLSNDARILLLEPRVASADDPGAALFPEGEPRLGVFRRGRAIFEGVPSSARTLRLVPGGAASERHGDLADVTFDVDLLQGDEHYVSVRLERGALLRVRALEHDGSPLAARARVRDAAGAHVPTLFVARNPAGGTSTSTWGLDENTGGAGWNHVVPNLSPGEYVLEVELEGRARRDIRFRLTAGVQNEVTAQF
jgi:RNA polymerase sigma-70 factor (ECF subfamily)